MFFEYSRLEAGCYVIECFDLPIIAVQRIGDITRKGKTWHVSLFDEDTSLAASSLKRAKQLIEAKADDIRHRILTPVPSSKDLKLAKVKSESAIVLAKTEAEIINPKPIPSKDPQIKPGSHVEIWGKKAIVLATLRLKPSNKPSHVKIKYDSGRTAQPLIENCTLID